MVMSRLDDRPKMVSVALSGRHDVLKGSPRPEMDLLAVLR